MNSLQSTPAVLLSQTPSQQSQPGPLLTVDKVTTTLTPNTQTKKPQGTGTIARNKCFPIFAESPNPHLPSQQREDAHIVMHTLYMLVVYQDM